MVGPPEMMETQTARQKQAKQTTKVGSQSKSAHRRVPASAHTVRSAEKVAHEKRLGRPIRKANRYHRHDTCGRPIRRAKIT